MFSLHLFMEGEQDQQLMTRPFPLPTNPQTPNETQTSKAMHDS